VLLIVFLFIFLLQPCYFSSSALLFFLFDPMVVDSAPCVESLPDRVFRRRVPLMDQATTVQVDEKASVRGGALPIMNGWTHT
jgi:hypothetical protein